MTKPTKWHVRPAKTQISLGIHPVWSVFTSAWRKLGLRLWSDWADAQVDLSLRWHTVILLVLSWGGSYIALHIHVHVRNFNLTIFKAVHTPENLHTYVYLLLCNTFVIKGSNADLMGIWAKNNLFGWWSEDYQGCWPIICVSHWQSVHRRVKLKVFRCSPDFF